MNGDVPTDDPLCGLRNALIVMASVATAAILAFVGWLLW